MSVNQVFTSDGEDWEGGVRECFAGQVNRLCGTAARGTIFLTTGLHSGDIGLTVDVVDAPPPIAPIWEDVVEAPFSISEQTESQAVLWLEEYITASTYPICIGAGNYRVRYCARNMDHAREIDTLVDEEPIDFYALYFWPDDSSAPDRVIKQTSDTAKYWHGSNI